METTHDALLRQITACDKLLGYFQTIHKKNSRYKQMEMSAHRDDSNVTVSYPGGTKTSNATVTHSHVYKSRFRDEKTSIYFTWSTLVKIDEADDNRMRAIITLTGNHGRLLANEQMVMIEDASSGHRSYYETLSTIGSVSKAVGEIDMTFEQRIRMDWSSRNNTSSTCYTDNFELLITEIVK